MADEGTGTVVAALRRLSADVAPPETVLTGTYRRAGRLRLRRRAVLAGALVLVLVAGGTAAQRFAVPRHGPVGVAAPTAQDLLTEPTRGDLAHDADYVTAALATWTVGRTGLTGPPNLLDTYHLLDTYLPTGTATVALAQETPAGPVAIVVQRARPIEIGKNAPREELLVGYLGPDTSHQPSVLDVDVERLTDRVAALAFLAGPDRSALVVLDRGGDDRVYSTGRTYRPDGTVDRVFQTIPFVDGVGVVTVPGGTDQTAVAVAATSTDTFHDGVHVANALPPAERGQSPAVDHRLPWNGDLWVLPDNPRAAAAWGVSRLPGTTNGRDAATPVIEAWRRAFDADRADPFAGSSGESLWFACGALPDGRAFVVGDGQLGDDASYLYGAVVDHGRQTRLFGGRVDPAAALPVRLRFPDRQGWLVAAKGATFRYRVGPGPWLTAGREAALLPAGATQVEVTPAGRQPAVVALA
jgi:hypothetical protein